MSAKEKLGEFARDRELDTEDYSWGIPLVVLPLLAALIHWWQVVVYFIIIDVAIIIAYLLGRGTIVKWVVGTFATLLIMVIFFIVNS